MNYYDKAKTIKDEILTNRRAFHSFAETGFDLPQTLARVEEALRSYGYTPKRVGKAGITCTVGRGGKVILLRGDMDALPIAEASGLPFAAQNGHCHSCGHDCHTAMLLGAARLLKENEANLSGTVKFMFQPAEELLAGALDMIEGGILENPKVDVGLGMHITVGGAYSKTGTLSYAPEAASYSGDAVTITVIGRDAHGSTPELGVDAITIAAHIVIALQEILAREVPCTDPSVLIVGKISGGSSCNTLSGNAVLECSVRATSPERREHLKTRLKEIAENTARTFRGEAKVDFVYGMPPMVNDPALSAHIARYCEDLVPTEDIHPLPASCGTEDFTAVSQCIPTAFLHLGAGSPSDGHTFGMHNPKMLVDEDSLPLGAALYAHTATRYLEEHR